MSAHRLQAYQFHSPAHWQRCLAIGFDSPGTDGLSVSRPLGAHARPAGPPDALSAIAVDRFDRPVWRQIGTPAQSLGWMDEAGLAHGPFPIEGAIAQTKRFQLDRYGLWSFTPDQVVRYDRDTLQRDLVLGIAELGTEPHARVLDIASDGAAGLWILMFAPRGQTLAHADCHGCVSSRAVPCDSPHASQLAVLDRGRTLALLCPDDHCLVLIDVARHDQKDGQRCRLRHLDDLEANFRPERIASDGDDCLALGGSTVENGASDWHLYLLDRFGELRQGPFAELFRPPSTPRSISLAAPADFAVGRNCIWFATDRGLWRVDTSDDSGRADAVAVLLSPLLQSPARRSAHRWLRAELSVDLTEGACLEVGYATTDDPATVESIVAIERDDSMSRAARQELIWSLLDDAPQPSRTFEVAAPLSSADGGSTRRVEIPLFATDASWLALRLRVQAPSFAQPPTLKELRIVYDDRSLMRYLPTHYSHPDNDPETVMRRLVGVIETTTQAIDESIASIGKSIGTNDAPDEWLDYLCSWLDLPSHVALASTTKRALLRDAGALLEARGTTRGVKRLLECIAGDRGAVEVHDTTSEHGAIVLGGRGRNASPLAGILGGRRRGTPSLGGKAVLGSTRLCAKASGGPLDVITPILRIDIRSDGETRAANRPYLDDVLSQYLPVGVMYRIRWRIADLAKGNPHALVLDAKGLASLGIDSRIGRTVLGGRASKQIRTGFNMGFELR
ncbi:hypothetical protein GCM10027431_26430 [Lysobacter rhizosphaerae]